MKNFFTSYIIDILTEVISYDFNKSTLCSKGGGYILTREPSEYIVGDIIELTEGPLAPVACLQPDAEVCNRKDICVTLPLWEKYYTLVHDFFFHITLEDVINNNF